MTDALFAMGVIADDDRPRQHRPLPVRDMEVEVSPVRDPRRRCVDCGLLAPSARPELCVPCLRERQLREKNRALKRDHNARSAERDIIIRIRERGHIRTHTNNRHIIDRLLASGTVRLLTDDERQQQGLQRYREIVVLCHSVQG